MVPRSAANVYSPLIGLAPGSFDCHGPSLSEDSILPYGSGLIRAAVKFADSPPRRFFMSSSKMSHTLAFLPDSLGTTASRVFLAIRWRMTSPSDVSSADRTPLLLLPPPGRGKGRLPVSRSFGGILISRPSTVTRSTVELH